jgi:putative membrane protein
MGAADVVPGVSGGTIAVVLGIYERLLDAVRGAAAAAGRLLRGDWRGCGRRLAAVDWWLLVPLLVGILGTIALLAAAIETQLHERPETMAGLFCGLVAASAVSACRLFEWRGALQTGLMAVSAAATFALLGLQSGPVADPSLPVLAGAGAVAVCAMILPGISGAFLLLMLGMYGAVINVVTDLRYGDAAVFLAGAAVGLALFSTVLGRLLDRARNPVMAVLVGLMAGSLRVLWPWPNGVGVISRHEHEVISGTGLAWPPADEWLAPTVAAAAGFAAVLIITRLSRESAPARN